MANETRPFAVITGASMGIGFHLANVFAQHGYDLLITSGSEKIEEAGTRIRSVKRAGSNCRGGPADV